MQSITSGTVDDVRSGYVVYREGDHVAHIPGEILSGGFLQADYVLYVRNFFHWKPPHDTELITAEYRENIIKHVCACLLQRGIKVDVQY